MPTRTAALHAATAEPGLARYFDQIRRFPLLEPEQEYLLAKRWREHGDRDAAQQLVTSHLRLAAKRAMEFRRYGLPVAELIAEANIGLMQAVKRFDPDKGFRLATYAVWWIRAAVQQYILRTWSLVKLGTTASHRMLFFKLRAAKSRISALDENLRADQAAVLARHMGVSEQDVLDMNQRLQGDASLNVQLRDDSASEWQDWLVDEGSNQEAALVRSEESDMQRTALRQALRVLNDRERAIFVGRHLTDEPITLEVLAERYSVSRERVRQIEARAFQKVQQTVKTLLAAPDGRSRAHDAAIGAQAA